MEFLEKSQGWKEPDFDTVLQYLRTILLRRTLACFQASGLMLTISRWCLSYLYFTKYAFSATLSHSLNPWNHISSQAAPTKAQRYRPRQDCRPNQLGFVGQDSSSWRFF